MHLSHLTHLTHCPFQLHFEVLPLQHLFTELELITSNLFTAYPKPCNSHTHTLNIAPTNTGQFLDNYEPVWSCTSPQLFYPNGR